jgi:ferredoxin
MSVMRKIVLWLRRVFAALVLVSFVALFAGAPWCVARHLAPLAKTQFWPSVAGGTLAFAAIVAVTLVFGRWYCGVTCPLGILQDVAFALNRRRSQKPSGKIQWAARCAFLAAFAAFGFFGPFFAWIEPYGIFGRIFTTASGSILGAAIFALAIWRGRAWCNWICPVGTILGAVSRILPTGLKIDPAKCIGCRKCEKNCRAAAIAINGGGGSIDAAKCVQCRDCTATCPKGAISFGLTRERASAKADASAREGATRREFLVGAVAGTAAIAAEAVEDKIYDGGFAPVSSPGIDVRNAPLRPAGAHSEKHFRSHCVGCQLCVKECPGKVLRPSTRLKDFMLPEMAFDKGFCTIDCNRCGEVCPARAIEKIPAEMKPNIHIGEAVWHKDRCLAAKEGVNCMACLRHCPVKAIVRIDGPGGVKIPVVDADKCIGCGACEHVCPARPMPAMTVRSNERHREIWPSVAVGS